MVLNQATPDQTLPFPESNSGQSGRPDRGAADQIARGLVKQEQGPGVGVECPRDIREHPFQRGLRVGAIRENLAGGGEEFQVVRMAPVW